MVLDIPGDSSPASISSPSAPANDPYGQSKDPYGSPGLAETTAGTASSASTSGGTELWSMKTPDGNVYGPVDFSEMRQWLAEGRISSQCQLQRDGERTWQNASMVFPELATPAMSTSGNNPYQSPTGGARHPTNIRPGGYRSHNGVVVLILGILGIMFCGVLSIVAWVMGSTELAGIRRGEIDPEGKGLATAGMILGIVGVILYIGGFALGCLLAAAGA